MDQVSVCGGGGGVEEAEKGGVETRDEMDARRAHAFRRATPHPPHFPQQDKSLLVGAALLAAAAFACYALFRCARRRARAEYAAEMAQVQLERAEIDAAAATAATAEEGAAATTATAEEGAAPPSSADRPKRALKPALLARLPTFTYQDPVPTQGETGAAGASTADAPAATPRTESGRRCIICMDPLAGQRCVTLPCGHLFHAECVVPWLANEDGTCPECRYDVSLFLTSHLHR